MENTLKDIGHNRISNEEKKHIREFLLLHKFNTEELYEEMFDHLATAYEHEPNDEKDIVKHLNKFFYDNGMTAGLEKMRAQKSLAYSSTFKKLMWQELKSLFEWPLIVYTVLAFGSIILLQQLISYHFILFAVMVISIVYTVIHYLEVNRKYAKSCKLTNKPYSKCLKNETAFSWIILPLLSVNVFNMLSDQIDLIPATVHALITTLFILFLILCEIDAFKTSEKYNKLKPTAI